LTVQTNAVKSGIVVSEPCARVGCARSSAFLSAYCATAWLGPAFVQRAFGDMRWWTIMAGVPAAGLAVVLEKPSRRQELGGAVQVEFNRP
jgi:hypothetical protein